MSQTALEKFQQLLRELFEFDMADLDFGIYRIMNHKRKVIERWVTEDLPNLVRQELQQGTLVAQQKMLEELDTVREEIQKTAENLGEKPFDADGNLLIWQDKPIGKKYIELREKAIHARNSQALEAAVYNHLYTFFSRYWQEGDFISKRRYSRKERYAIPYNGEEVYLYWANHDQYYVKTGEYFTDYTWKAPNGVSVHFKLKAADVEQNNVKGEKRFFLPVPGEITWYESARTLTIPFEYRPLTAQEAVTYGQKNQQEAIIAKAVAEIPGHVKAPDALAALTAERRQTSDGTPVSYLEHHLRQYTARNTRDFFIHKDLRGFLSRELDFYLKNEVLNLEELEAAGEKLAKGWFELLRLIKRVGNHIIAFLAQVEDFQKMLWEKKKFVTETFYVITLGSIPESFYADIAACEAQWEEWRNLLSVQAPKNVAERMNYLKQHPTLPLDTRHFSQDFTDRLLASFESLDEMTDGLLVHAENWQALNLLQEKYREQVKCIYIDPPYNTGNDEFLYRDNYQHSSWLAMMQDRLFLGKEWLREGGTIFVSCDDNEMKLLGLTLESLFSPDNEFVIPVIMNLKGNQDEFGFAGIHEYVMVTLRDKSKSSLGQFVLDDEEIEDWEEDELGYYKRGANLKSTGVNAPREKRPNLFFPIYITPNNEISLERTSDEDVEMLPVTDGQEMSWRWSKTKISREKHNLIVVREGDNFSIYKKQRPSIGDLPSSKPKSVFYKPEYSSGNGTAQIKYLFGKKAYTNPKPLNLIKDYLQICTDKESIILDYFAGSGTTGHAVIALNCEDGGRRKFILVEMAEYFDTVLLPRIKKVTFTPEWRDGKPRRTTTPEEAERSPRIVKVIRLESYEDALNNLTFDEEGGQKALELFKDDYLLSYMLKWETRRSETLLNVEKLQSPFSYKLRIHRDGETREQSVDLPETFNYLIGLDVEKRQVLDNDGKRYLVYRGTTRDGRRTAVIWRETSGWTEEDYRRDRDFVTAQKLTEGADDIFINGDSLILGARALEAVFKAKMFGQTE